MNVFFLNCPVISYGEGSALKMHHGDEDKKIKNAKKICANLKSQCRTKLKSLSLSS
jgi:hypothetical protein